MEYTASLGNAEIFRILFTHPHVKAVSVCILCMKGSRVNRIKEILLLRAAHSGSTEILKLLLDRGVDVNALVKVNILHIPCNGILTIQ